MKKKKKEKKPSLKYIPNRTGKFAKFLYFSCTDLLKVKEMVGAYQEPLKIRGMRCRFREFPFRRRRVIYGSSLYLGLGASCLVAYLALEMLLR